MNREQRRYFQKKQYQKYGYWMVALERTQWKGRNIFMVTLVRADLALNLTKLKPHKRLFFQQGFQALSLMKQAV
ncbi:MAG: hypothetical protein ACLBM4_07845 [Dolichospermum sp.]